MVVLGAPSVHNAVGATVINETAATSMARRRPLGPTRQAATARGRTSATPAKRGQYDRGRDSCSAEEEAS